AAAAGALARLHAIRSDIPVLPVRGRRVDRARPGAAAGARYRCAPAAPRDPLARPAHHRAGTAAAPGGMVGVRHGALPPTRRAAADRAVLPGGCAAGPAPAPARAVAADRGAAAGLVAARSEEHTSELQSRENLVCRLLLEKKN